MIMGFRQDSGQCWRRTSLPLSALPQEPDWARGLPSVTRGTCSQLYLGNFLAEPGALKFHSAFVLLQGIPVLP